MVLLMGWQTCFWSHAQDVATFGKVEHSSHSTGKLGVFHTLFIHFPHPGSDKLAQLGLVTHSSLLLYSAGSQRPSVNNMAL